MTDIDDTPSALSLADAADAAIQLIAHARREHRAEFGAELADAIDRALAALEILRDLAREREV